LTLPLALLPFTIIRSWKIIHAQADDLSDKQIANRLNTINILSAVLGIVCVSWALTLFTYGDAYTKGHAAFFICLTSVAVITCLMHLRQAGLLMFTTVLCPTAVFFMLHESLVFKAIAVNILLVSGTMLFIMFRYSQAYTDAMEKQGMLE
jgi:predicted signal transduction protein with EAL and GGDEF domain